MYIIGFDYGTRRIGIAIGQTLTATAHPLTIVSVKKKQINWAHITTIIQEWQPDALVVGLPKHADGSDNTITAAVRRFSWQLQGRYQLPVHTIDETLSSVAAVEKMLSSPFLKKKNRKNLDAFAAQIILETWFTECHK
ncbi:Holliday junction resolvase RuvX [Candidatus Marithioploca araucensis]|jgi:putative Holliday junction resolvase|uniref:Putative pre-16S rRNA nuclease n=1 Tax=Candidatus Marithioploca araucensis TaxID=70273 RepID=A0ABT7VTH0_9GAMM|nr:Holliday junction resolvase RuvX [Candidatus Marithioploca araucensis]